MKIAILGAGALGCTYAAHLARLGPEVDVVLVVRTLDRAPSRVVAERVSPPGVTLVLEAPAATTTVPDDADVVLLAVRVDQLAQLGEARLREIATRGPTDRIVVPLTPMLPEIRARVADALGPALVDGMPGVVAYAPAGGAMAPAGELHLRYWTPKSSPTALEARPDDAARDAKVRALQAALVKAGVPAHVARGVHATNQATTIAMFPLLLAIAAAGGSIDALLADGALLKLALAATKEARAVAKPVGELAGFASILLSFAGTFTLRAGMKIVRSRAPEALTFLERHFGGKLKGQNRVMLEAILRLAEAHRLEVASLRALAGRAGIS